MFLRSLCWSYQLHPLHQQPQDFWLQKPQDMLTQEPTKHRTLTLGGSTNSSESLYTGGYVSSSLTFLSFINLFPTLNFRSCSFVHEKSPHGQGDSIVRYIPSVTIRSYPILCFQLLFVKTNFTRFIERCQSIINSSEWRISRCADVGGDRRS
jgi:hypothetical protein